MKYTHVLFDADDTLLDFRHSQKCALSELLQLHGLAPSSDIFALYEGINHSLWHQFEKGEVSKDYVQTTRFDALFSALNYNVSGHLANEQYQSFLGNQTRLMPHAHEVCQELSKFAQLIIVTNGVGTTQRRRIGASAISPYISHIFVSEEIGFQKPDCRFFAYVFDHIGVAEPELERFLLVGDSPSSDIQGANAVGIDSCWFNPAQEPTPISCSPTFTITDLRQLLGF